MVNFFSRSRTNRIALNTKIIERVYIDHKTFLLCLHLSYFFFCFRNRLANGVQSRGQ